MVTDRIRSMLQACEGGKSPFPPTALFNETWMLRLVLDWYADHPEAGERLSPIAPAKAAEWYSEALLPSAFQPRYRGDRLAESRTHADGVVGHLNIGRKGATDLSLKPEALQIVVAEAKIYGKLSGGVKNAPFFDQAARSVACLAELLRRADRDPEDLDAIRFALVAPKERAADGSFDDDLNPRSIRRKVQARVEGYEGALDGWFHDWFEPTVRRLDVVLLSWEEIIEEIAFEDMASGQVIDSFYGQCLRYNRQQRNSAPERQPLPAWAGPRKKPRARPNPPPPPKP